MAYERGSEWRKWDLHVHTASSYDYRYNAEDADEKLCEVLRENNVAAVAITDHFLIDKQRIKHLKEIASEIVFFPGVELRTDKGDTNIHIILIFNPESNIDELAEDFNSFKRISAKNKDDNQKIYWDYKDIVKFSKKHKALISIHAGSKASGIDDKISNALPIGQAIKEEYAESVNFFEVGKIDDIEKYKKNVFSQIGEKPIIICSDNHDPRKYSTREFLWIKSNISFDGILQCLYQPKERVYVGTIPPELERAQRDKQSNIGMISAQRIAEPKNKIYNWFDFSIKLNSGLIAIIGNKGSGKSALSDIIGHLCRCTTMSKASFLNNTRFRKAPKNYASDYEATIIWSDYHQEKLTLAECDYKTTIENAQYLPQKYIEDVCNDMDNVFQNEIDKVIFSYVDQTERGTAKNLNELVTNKSKVTDFAIKKIKNELNTINHQIIKLEERKTTQYKTFIDDCLKKLNETLERHSKIKPLEVNKPIGKTDDKDYQKQMDTINKEIIDIEEKIAKNKNELTSINAASIEASQLLEHIRLLEYDIENINKLIADFAKKNDIKCAEFTVLSTPKEEIKSYINEFAKKKTLIQENLNGDENQTGLITLLQQIIEKKHTLISTADIEEKKYQKYLADIKIWEAEKIKIEGDETTENTIAYFNAEQKFLNEKIEIEYAHLRIQRKEKVVELFKLKENLAGIYQEIYRPIKNEIVKLLGNIDEEITFGAEIQLLNNTISELLLVQINQKYAGIFKGKAESENKMSQFVKETEFDKVDSVVEFIDNVLTVVDEDIDSSSKKIQDKKLFYQQLCNLEYIGVAYKLKMGGRDLGELSPGERGIVLLVFYLALSQNNVPIIIDQPEDNLDNQSVFSKLVPCICAAKKKRQVIIVTHNPNIAIACDAEQIIFCEMNKTTHMIEYSSGAIEEPIIKQHVIDVLEGTMPAFDLRKRKYNSDMG